MDKTTKAQQEMLDVKYLNSPNIGFSLTKKDDDREIYFSEQRKLMGFDDSETWCLSSTICKFTLPRLQRFREIGFSHPSNLTVEQWFVVLDKIILAFQLIIRDDSIHIWNEIEEQQVVEGLDLFRKYFLGLWW